MGLYNPDGSIRITPVTGSTPTGLYSRSGSINVVYNTTPNVYCGLYHPCGALNVTEVDASVAAYPVYAPNGSRYISFTANNNGIPFVAIGYDAITIGGISPVLDFDFQSNTGYMNGSLVNIADIATLSRASSGTASTLGGSIVTFPSATLRRTNRGLLTEAAVVNNVLQSQDFSTSWILSQVSTTVDSQLALDGTVSADLVIPNTTSTGHYVRQGLASLSLASTYTFSIYVKVNTEHSFQLSIFETAASANGTSAIYNLDTLTVSGVTNAGLGTNAAGNIDYIGNGWYRLQLVGQPNTAGTGLSVQCRFLKGGASTFAGDGILGAYLWGAQLELGTLATSYIATTTVAATRSADIPLVSGTNFSDWFNPLEGTLVFTAEEYTLSKSVVAISDGTSAERILRLTSSGAIPQALITDTTAQFASAIGSPLTSNTKIKSVLAYKAADCIFAVDGTLGTLNTTATLPTVDRMYIGASASGAVQLQNYIQRVTYFNTRLTDAQVQALSTP